MRAHDVVVAVDGRPACEQGLAALRERLADLPAGERVAMTVRRSDETIEVALLLRDLV